MGQRNISISALTAHSSFSISASQTSLSCMQRNIYTHCLAYHTEKPSDAVLYAVKYEEVMLVCVCVCERMLLNL